MEKEMFALLLPFLVAASDIELRGGYDNPCHTGSWDHYCAGNVYARNQDGLIGPVCDYEWGPEEATVVCRQLGYNYGSPVCQSRFGNVSSFAMGNVQCSGNEMRIQDCEYVMEDYYCQTAAGAECFDDMGQYGTTFAPKCDTTTTAVHWDTTTTEGPWDTTTEGPWDTTTEGPWDTTTTTDPSEDCPTGWFNTESEDGCFLFLYSKTMNWAEAHAECELVEGFMAEPKNLEMADLLASIAFVENELVGISSWWIGLSDWSHESRWVWEHSVEDAVFTNWVSGSPHTGSNSADCAMMDLEDGFLWRDTDCLTTQASVICQREGKGRLSY